MTKPWFVPAAVPLAAAAVAAGAQTPPPAPPGPAPQANMMVSHQHGGPAIAVRTRPVGYGPVLLIRKGTPIALRIAGERAELQLRPGDRLRLVVAEPVRARTARLSPDGSELRDLAPDAAGGAVELVPAGRPATAEVVEAQGGRIAIRLLSVNVHGQDVPLRGRARGTLRPGTRVEGAFADDFVPAQPLTPIIATGELVAIPPPRAQSVAIPVRMPPPDPRVAAPARPRAALSSYITAADYPETALRAGEQGAVRVILEVAPNGRVVTCVVTRPSGSTALDAATCRILHARARFTPAVDTNGNPIASWLEHEARWSLPGAN